MQVILAANKEADQNEVQLLGLVHLEPTVFTRTGQWQPPCTASAIFRAKAAIGLREFGCVGLRIVRCGNPAWQHSHQSRLKRSGPRHRRPGRRYFWAPSGVGLGSRQLQSCQCPRPPDHSRPPMLAQATAWPHKRQGSVLLCPSGLGLHMVPADTQAALSSASSMMMRAS